MITYTPLSASNSSIKTLVARQWQTNIITQTSILSVLRSSKLTAEFDRFPTGNNNNIMLVGHVSRHEEARLQQLRSELDTLKHESSRLRDEASRNKRQVGEVTERLRRKSKEKNRLTLAITELKNAQEEEETEVDTATYVSPSG